MSFDTKESVIDELDQYIASDGDLYRLHTAPIRKALAIKKARGVYKHDLAVKAFSHLAEVGAKKYAKDHGGTWHRMFDVPTRRAVASRFTEAFEAEYKLGNYDYLLPPKRQKPKKASHAHARKAKSTADYEAEGYKAHTWYLADCPYSQPKIRDAWQRGAWKWQQEQRTQRPSNAAASHATRKTKSQLNREIAAALGKRRRA